MPGSRRGRGSPGRSSGAPNEPGKAAPGYAWRRGERSGEPPRANPVYDARYTHLTSRDNNKLTPTQAQAVIAAAILRQLYAVITTGRKWDPMIATHGTNHHPMPMVA